MDGARAAVYQNVALKIQDGENREKIMRGRERVLVRREKSGWKIYGGLHGG